jgi:outer membrane lipoprotein SlyB
MQTKTWARMGQILASAVMVLATTSAALAAITALSYASPVRAQAASAGIYDRGNALQVGSGFTATVIQTREVETGSRSSTQATGASLGGVLGALAGDKAGNGRWQSQVALGAVGALIGAKVGESAGTSKSLEIIAKDERSDRVLVVVMPEATEKLVAGDRVFVVQVGGSTRMVKMATQDAVPVPVTAPTPVLVPYQPYQEQPAMPVRVRYPY